jgi:hypothetical protein
MLNLEKFSNWNLNEGLFFSDFKWVSAPKNITSSQKSSLEGKMSIFGSDIIDTVNFSYTSRYWESLKKRLGENKIQFKYGNSSAIPKQWIYWSEKVIYSDQRPLLSKNSSGQKVIAYYPLSYNGSVLDKFWVIAIWKGEDGKKYLREMTLIPTKGDSVSQDNAQNELKFESVDQIILQEITNIESEFYDTKILLDIYQQL